MISVLQGQHEMGMGTGLGELWAWHNLEDSMRDDCYGCDVRWCDAKLLSVKYGIGLPCSALTARVRCQIEPSDRRQEAARWCHVFYLGELHGPWIDKQGGTGTARPWSGQGGPPNLEGARCRQGPKAEILIDFINLSPINLGRHMQAAACPPLPCHDLVCQPWLVLLLPCPARYL